MPISIILLCLCILESVVSAYSSFLKVFGVALLSDSRIEILWMSEGEIPLIFCPAGELLFITEENAIKEAHHIAGILPHITTQLLKSQVHNNSRVVNQLFRITMASNCSEIISVQGCRITAASFIHAQLYYL